MSTRHRPVDISSSCLTKVSNCTITNMCFAGRTYTTCPLRPVMDTCHDITVIMLWGFLKSLASALLYIHVSVRLSSEALFFFGHLFSRFNHLEAPGHQQATPLTPSVVSSPIDLHDALEALLELDDKCHRSPLGRLYVVLINNCEQF